MTSVLQCIGAGAVVPFVITDVTEQGRLNKTKQSQVFFCFFFFWSPVRGKTAFDDLQSTENKNIYIKMLTLYHGTDC